MAKIETKSGYIILVDESMLPLLSNYKWHVGNHGYAVASITSSEVCPTCNQRKRLSILMHRLIMGEPKDDRIYVDHINHNRLDNRLENLRWVTHAENMMNLGVRKDNKSGFRGITWDQARGKWFVSIRVLGRTIDLGRYNDLEEAKQAWLDKFEEINGE